MKRGLCATEVAGLQVVGRGDGAGQEAATERRVGHQADAELTQEGQDLALHVPRPQRVLGLQGGDRVHGVGPTDGVGRRLAQPEEADLAGGDQLGHRADGLLDRHRLVDPVLVVEVDVVEPEPLQAGVAGLADVRRTAVDAAEALVARVPDVAELGGQHDLLAPVGDGPADQHLVGERPVHVGGVEQRDAEVERAVDGGDGLALVGGAVELRHAHAAEAEGGHLEGVIAGAEDALRRWWSGLLRSWAPLFAFECARSQALVPAGVTRRSRRSS